MVALEQAACAAPVVMTTAAKATKLSFAISCPPFLLISKRHAGSGKLLAAGTCGGTRYDGNKAGLNSSKFVQIDVKQSTLCQVASAVTAPIARVRAAYRSRSCTGGEF